MDGLESIFSRLFEEASRAHASEPAWLKTARADAFARFRALGVPTTRLEDWKYSSLTALGRFEFASSPAEGEPRLFECESTARLVFVDGKLDRSRSNLAQLPQGLKVSSVSERISDPGFERAIESYAKQHADGMKALNTALFTDGAWIEAAPGTVVDRPVHLVFLTSEGRSSVVRNVVRLGARAELRLIEEFATRGERSALSNTTTQIDVASGASLEALKLQHENPASGHLADTRVEQARDSVYESLWVSLGALVSRNEIHTRLGETNSECRLLGLYASRGSEQVDSHTVIDHAAPGCRSHETYKGVLAGDSKGSFTGRIVVREDAQKTDSHQLNRNLLLSERAVANTRPQLQISADDVKCSHGATVGRLDPEQLFYLRSRGIGLTEARKLVSRAFAGEVIEQGGWGAGLGLFFDRWLGGGAA